MRLSRTLLGLGLTAVSLPLTFSAAVAAEPPPSQRPPIQWTVTNGDGRVGTYVSKPWGFSTSSYWIEGPDGLVLVDTQFLPSAAEEMVTWAERITGKKAVLAIVLHANPDKFNGTATLQKRGIRVVTSRQVAELLPKVHKLRASWFQERYAPDYPTAEPKPDVFGDATTTLKAAGLDLKLHVLGPGCSEAHVVVEFDKHLFVGDLVANNAHAWLEIGKTDQWLERLTYLQAQKPEFVHPGRGPGAGPELLTAQVAYLHKVIELVAAEKPAPGKDPDKAVERVQAKLQALYPAHDFGVFLGLGLPAEWQRQADLAGKAKRKK